MKKGVPANLCPYDSQEYVMWGFSAHRETFASVNIETLSGEDLKSAVEALIQGVLDYIVEEPSIGRSPSTEDKGIRPGERLAAHFDELVRQVREKPEMFLVLAEINARAVRDPKVRSVVAENDERWKHFLMQIVKEGIQTGEFNSPLGPETAVDAIVAMVRGLSITYARRPNAMERPLRQLCMWLNAR